jgi:hypothetical protein
MKTETAAAPQQNKIIKQRSVLVEQPKAQVKSVNINIIPNTVTKVASARLSSNTPRQQKQTTTATQ